eukprot:933-Heterococcus_DN1.PRE.2
MQLPADFLQYKATADMFTMKCVRYHMPSMSSSRMQSYLASIEACLCVKHHDCRSAEYTA